MLNVPFKKKIIIFAIILVFLNISCLAIGIWGLHQIQIFREEADKAVKIHNNFDELRILFEQTLMGPHDYIIHGNPDEKATFLKDYENILIKKGGLKSLIFEQEKKKDSEFYEALESAKKQFLVIEEKLPLLKNKLLNIFNFKFPISNQMIGPYMEEVDLFIRELEMELKKEANVLAEFSNKSMNKIHIILMRVVILLVILGVVTLFLGIILSYFLIKSITKPVNNLIWATRKIKAGDLAIRATVETNDEIGELANSFNDMVEKLVDTQERVSAILHGTGDGICLIDKDFNLLRINKQMEKFSDQPIKYDGETKCYDYFKSMLCHTDECILKQILRGEAQVEVETLKKTKDDKRLAIHIIATPLKKNGQIIGAIESIRDITKRKLAEEALRRSELINIEKEKVFLVFNMLPALIYLLSSNYSISFANRKFQDIFGDPKERKCYEIFYQGTKECKDCNFSHILLNKERKKWQLSTPEGRIFEMHNNAFTDANGSQKVLVLGIDITDRIQMEKAKNRAERQLEEQRTRAILSDRLRSLGEMASGMAHELNQPLVGVRGLAEHILISFKRGWKISEKNIIEKIQLIVEQTDRMTYIIEHARKFARGADDSELLPIKINEVINSSLNFIEAQLRNRGFILDCDLYNDLPPVLANPFSIEEVILNLISNARDGMEARNKTDNRDDSSRIIVRTFTKSEGPDNYVKIEVIDHGVGISEDLIDKVFDPFFTTKSSDKGTGLGLAISKSIIEEIKGTLDIQSKPGLGTTATITLPAMSKQNGEKKHE